MIKLCGSYYPIGKEGWSIDFCEVEGKNINDLFVNFKNNINDYLRSIYDFLKENKKLTVDDLFIDFYFANEENEIIDDVNNDLSDFYDFLENKLK